MGGHMKRIIALVLVVLFICPVVSAKIVSVKGGVSKTGVYKPPHFKTSPNKTKIDNWSTKGNVNPTTGKKGTVDPFKIKIKQP